ncbi:Sec-independent protein translocase subunit TatA [Streptomyces olivaceoviridis]|uniref:Sec-independent protein translocase subunit TatA n=1 Tax=Streptomyces olivaceoviridis TaxID=1921 RepID=UPI0036B957F1
MLRNGLEPWHLLIVAVVLIALFGSKKLPDAARGLGRSLRILKSEARAMREDDAADGTTTSTVPHAGRAPAADTATAEPATER